MPDTYRKLLFFDGYLRHLDVLLGPIALITLGGSDLFNDPHTFNHAAKNSMLAIERVPLNPSSPQPQAPPAPTLVT